MIYEYRCTKCSQTWEQQQSIHDIAITLCPYCNQQSAKRLISGGNGFLLKGDGWAKDLYSSSVTDKGDK